MICVRILVPPNIIGLEAVALKYRFQHQVFALRSLFALSGDHGMVLKISMHSSIYLLQPWKKEYNFKILPTLLKH